MEKLLSTVDDITEKMEARGYDDLYIRHGGVELDFQTGLASYLHEINATKDEPVYPIYAVSAISARHPGEPVSVVLFTIEKDAQKGLRIDSMSISMCTCPGGPLRASLELKLKYLEDIPSRQDACRLIEEQKTHLENSSKRQMPNPINTGGSRRMKLY